MSETQATAIVQMQLGRLSGLEREKIEEEYQQIEQKISEYKNILENESVVLDIIKNDLTQIKNKYGDERRTEIAMNINEIDDEDLIEEEDVIITLTHSGYTKRVPVTTYKSQHRGGRGISGMSTRAEDFVEHIFTTSTHNTILFFTTKGIVYRLKGYQIPEAGRQAKGTAIVNLLPLETDEKITAMIPIKDFEDGNYLMFVTRNGTVKKTGIMDYSKIRNSGLRAIELVEGDSLINVLLTDGTKNVIIGTRNGMAIRFDENDVRAMGRTTRGVRGISIKKDDFVVGACLAQEDKVLLVATENGFGKKTELSEYKTQNRGGKGILTYRLTEKTGKVAALATVNDENDIMLITSDGIIIRTHVSEISTYGRQTQGVRIMKLADGVKLVSMAVTEKDDETEDVQDNIQETENKGE